MAFVFLQFRWILCHAKARKLGELLTKCLKSARLVLHPLRLLIIQLPKLHRIIIGRRDQSEVIRKPLNVYYLGLVPAESQRRGALAREEPKYTDVILLGDGKEVPPMRELDHSALVECRFVRQVEILLTDGIVDEAYLGTCHNIHTRRVDVHRNNRLVDSFTELEP